MVYIREAFIYLSNKTLKIADAIKIKNKIWKYPKVKTVRYIFTKSSSLANIL